MSKETCSCTVIPSGDHPMKGFWSNVFKPSGEVPIKPERFSGIVVSGKAGVVSDLFWELDKSRCDAGQRYLISQYLAEAFGLSVASVMADFDDPTKKIPVRDRDVIVCFCMRHSRILMSS